MLVFAASAVAEDKPSGDNTAAQGVRLRVAWLAIQFLAAATISGLATDMPPPSDDKQIPRLEQVVAEAGRATAAYLNDAERQQLMTMFRLALTDTDRQLLMAEDGTAYVKTGDIPAEWLRDSSAQVRPLLYFAGENKAIANRVKAVIERQAMYIALDPYANAFRDDFTVWERKFELDSLSFPILLIWTYWKVTGDSTVFTPSVKMAFSRALETMLTEQDHDGVLPGHQRSGYHFKSDTQSSEKMPVGYTGMIWVAFRPSDDECLYNFPIPVEIQAVQALNALAEMERFIGRRDTAKRAETLGEQVKAGIEQYGIVDTPDYGRVYAYEVDGLGHANLMDDANIPSLLSIPYFGYVSEIDEIYMATRRFILSSSNPYFYEGTFKGEKISGIGSPHTPAGMIWPLAQEMQGMTTNQKDEQIRVLRMLLASDPGDHQPHESYAANNPKHFTRKDFGWAKAQFAEFVLRSILGRRPLPVPPKPGGDTYVNNLPSQLTFSQVGGGFNAAPR
jgi:hypothetical protein